MLIVASVTLALYFSYIILKHDYIGAMAQIEGENAVVSAIEPLTWAARNLEVGDRVLLADGKKPSEYKQLVSWDMLEQFSTLVIEDSSGKTKTLEVDTTFDSQIVFQFIIPLTILLFSYFCSYLIYNSYKKAENSRKSALLLIMFLFTFLIAYMCGGASARGDDFSRTLVSLLLIATPIAYLHFMYAYYKELNTVWFSERWIWIMYSIIPLNLLIVESNVFLGLDGQFLKTMNLGSFLVSFGITSYLMLIGIKKVSYKTQKYMIKVLILSNSFAFLPFLVLYVIPFVIFKVAIFSPVFLTGFLLVIPISLVYQFLATKIYDIEFIVGRLKYYSLIITIPAILEVILLVNIKQGNPTVYSIRTFLLIFIIMFLTLYLKEVFDYRFKLNKFSEKLNYQDRLMTYTEKIRVASSIDEVLNLLKAKVIGMMLIDKVFFLEVGRETSVRILNSDCEEVANPYFNEIEETKEKIGSIVQVEKGFLLNIGEAEGKKFILLALSDVNTPKLTMDEKQWLNSLAYYTNVTLENFMKIEHLLEHLDVLESRPVWLNKIVYKLEERQRSSLAKDLHDSVLQDLMNIKRKAEGLDDKYRDVMKPDVQEEVSSIISSMESAINTTRKTCHELRPQLLYDLGLDKALKKLIDQHRDSNDYNVKITTGKLDDTIHEDVQLNLYRIVQELLNNAKKHSLADNISIVLVKIKEKIVLHYEDDGVGEDFDYIVNKEDSMGLSGIRERVNVLNGTVDIDTNPGEGFKVVIEI